MYLFTHVFFVSLFRLCYVVVSYVKFALAFLPIFKSTVLKYFGVYYLHFFYIPVVEPFFYI